MGGSRKGGERVRTGCMGEVDGRGQDMLDEGHVELEMMGEDWRSMGRIWKGEEKRCWNKGRGHVGLEIVG